MTNSVLDIADGMETFSQFETQKPLGIVDGYDHLHEKICRLEEEGLERVIERLVKRENFTQEHALKCRIEFLRFISLRFLETGERHSPAADVDTFWHAFILHTRDYMNFCSKHFGHYYHHEPYDHRVSTVTEVSPGALTKRLMIEIYPDHDAEIWDAAEDMCSNGYCD